MTQHITPDEKFQTLKNLITDLKRAAIISGATIFYDGTAIFADQIIVTDEEILVKHENCSDLLYLHSSDWDEGWYDPLEVLVDVIKGHFKLYNEVYY